MYTVFGASGQTGRIVADRLLAAGKPVRAVVRDASKAPRGAEVLVGSLSDIELVTRALEGAEGAYFMTPPDLRAKDLLGQNRRIAETYVAALGRAPIAHGVVLSSVGAQHTTGIGPATSNAITEQLLGGTGLALTYLRAPYFMENLAGSVHPMQSDGVLPVFGGGEHHAFPMIAARDIAAAAVEALLAPAATSRVIELRGPRDYSYADAAAIASKLLGRTVTATPAPLEAMAPALVQQAGFSPEVAALFVQMIEAGKQGLFAYTSAPKVCTTPLETVLAELLAR